MALDVASGGNPNSGSYADLYRAVNNGAALTIVSSNNVYKCPPFKYTDTKLVANTWSISIYKFYYSFKVRNDPYWFFYTYSTDGKYQDCRWDYGAQTSRGCSEGSIGVTFYVTQ